MSQAAPASPAGGGFDGLTVFAVEDDGAQLMWHDAVPGATLRIGDGVVTASRAGPGVGAVTGLAADTTYTITAGGRAKGKVRTLAPPPGGLLFRFATVSDLHVGERSFGMLPRFRERPDVDTAHAYPARCAAAALTEAQAWGAQRILVKGDLTWSGRQSEWTVVGRVLAAAAVPVHVTLGNHDVVPRAVDGHHTLADDGIESWRAEPEVIDAPGLRLVLAHSAARHHRYGHVDEQQQSKIVEAVGSASPAFVAMHHYVDRWPVPTRYPRGIARDEGRRLFASVAAANPATFVSFGHTHRNRRVELCGLTATEVGSTKDYPGVWAGYAVHEGGIRQVVRRVQDSSSLTWTEPTRGTVGGLWGPWSSGRRRWRCFSQTWPAR